MRHLLKNRTYEVQIGETFHRTVPANGWFRQINDSCFQSDFIQSMINKKFYLNSGEVYFRFKRGKSFSCRFKENDGQYKITGRCKKGKSNGKFVILDIKNKEIIWEGVISRGNE